MRLSQAFFSKKIQPACFPRLKLPTKIGDFEWQKSIYASQGHLVITDQHSPFEWVGSVGAYPCVINLIHAVNSSGEKIAACAHLSRQSSNTIRQMLKLINAQNILSVSLFSGFTSLSDPYVKDLFNAYEKEGISRKHISFKQGETQAALNVNTGKIILDPVFSVQNSGKNSVFDSCGNIYCLKPSIDTRNPRDTEKLIYLIKTIKSDVESGLRPLSDMYLLGSVQRFNRKIVVLDDDPISNSLKSVLRC